MRDHLGQFQIAGNMNFARGILLLEDGSGSSPLTPLGTGVGWIACRHPDAARGGRRGILLQTRPVGWAENDYVQASFAFSVSASGLLVARAQFRQAYPASCKTLALRLAYATGANAYIAELRVIPGTPATEYRDSAGNYQAIAALAYDPSGPMWLTLELAIDTRLHQYLHVAAHGITSTLPGIALYDLGADTTRYALALVRITAGTVAPAHAHVADLYAGEYLDP